MARQYDHQTEEGGHYFSEDGVDVSREKEGKTDAQLVDSQNPLAASSGQPLYETAPEYETSFAGRGGATLALGILSLVCFAFTGFLAMNYQLPLCLILCFAFSIPAWQGGRCDLLGMRAGAIQSKGKNLALVGMLLGLLITLIVAVILLVWTGKWGFALLLNK